MVFGGYLECSPLVKQSVALLICLAATLFSGCASNTVREWPAIDGRVFDAETNIPIEGVVVEILWEARSGYTRMCFYADNTYTDKNGYFHFESWKDSDYKSHREPWKRFEFHKAGYSFSDRNYTEQSYRKSHYYLKKSQYPQERLKELNDLSICRAASKQQWPIARSKFMEIEALGGDSRWLARKVVENILSEPKTYGNKWSEKEYIKAQEKIREKIRLEQ